MEKIDRKKKIYGAANLTVEAMQETTTAFTAAIPPDKPLTEYDLS